MSFLFREVCARGGLGAKKGGGIVLEEGADGGPQEIGLFGVDSVLIREDSGLVGMEEFTGLGVREEPLDLFGTSMGATETLGPEEMDEVGVFGFWGLL